MPKTPLLAGAAVVLRLSEGDDRSKIERVKRLAGPVQSNSVALVVEDSAPGVTAGIAAGMRVLAFLPEGDADWRPPQVPVIRRLAEVAGHLGPGRR